MDITSAIIITKLFETLMRLELPNNKVKMMGLGDNHYLEIWFQLKRTYHGQTLWQPYTIKNIQAIYGKERQITRSPKR